MGGSIAIAARFNDGQTICVDGWTNFIPNMVMNAITLSGDDSIVRRTLLKAAEHENYDGPQPLRAHGYGIVVIDFVAREIHSMQGYTSFGHKMLSQLLDLNASGWRDAEGDAEKAITHPFLPNKIYLNTLSEEANGLLDAGRVHKVGINGEPCERETLDRERAVALLDEETRAFLEESGRSFIELLMDTAPFTVHEYPEGGSLSDMKARLRAVGFPMTKADGLNAIFKKENPLS